ncbi:MAG: carboxymuconolactone decarboxylase family protein [Candidatus Dormibacteraeota bacterium]|nr:carboxymuconolactone decarboxylase family protein [Candidatus Dormibacteraeota bacterium]
MAKVELLTRDNAPLLAQPFFQGGDPGPIAAALAQVPELMETALPFIGSMFGPTAVEARIKEIVILRVSSANSCHYCTETHTEVARRLNFTPDELAALRGEGPLPAVWVDRERAAHQFSEAISERPDSVVAILRPHFSESEIVELVLLAATTVMLNRFATALELPV